jgi:outer membrane lipoprotein SlyB
MKIKKKTVLPTTISRSSLAKKARVERIETGAVSGAIAGGAAGSIAGPAGAVAGLVVGGAVGAVAGLAMSDASERRHARAAKIDLEIGVTGGELGAPSLKHPATATAADEPTVEPTPK